MDALFEFVKLAVVGLVAGLFSSVLASRDHRQKRWWELRVAAYQGAIEALSDLVYYYDKHWNAEVEQREMTKEFKAKLSATWDASFHRVRRLADGGAFLFSEHANAALTEFMKDEEFDSFSEHVDANLANAKKCLSTLVACSKEDLKLNVDFFERIG